MNLFIYTLGRQPYGDGDGVAGWGERKGKFPDLESALRGLLMAHPFPSVLTGRYQGVFIPGVSLDQIPDSHVIQVWSNEPDALSNIKAYSKKFPSARPDHWPHIGDGTNVGLHTEIHVSKIAEYQTPVVAGLLTDGSNTPASFSPAGRFSLTFSPANRNTLQVRMLQAQLAGIGAGMEANQSLEMMREQMGKFGEGMRMMSAYLGGTHGLQMLSRGDRASSDEPYSIFQTRLYLDEELGLIANLTDMDHRNMGEIDDWLMDNGRWKKLLPLSKCILVTRICREEKSYNGLNGFEAAYHNFFNMESLVWIRDGENLWRFATDIHFEERVFPSGDDAPGLVRAIQDMIWTERWSGKGRRESEERWKSFSEGEVKKRNPAAEDEPVDVKWQSDVEYRTLEAFLESEDYTPELDAYIKRRASDGARKHQREMMPFAMLVQGIVDHVGILNIPPGTDLFDLNTNYRYLRTINDFSDGITDRRYIDQWNALTKKEFLAPGTRIIGWRWATYQEQYSTESRWNIGKRGDGPFIFTVAAFDLEKGKSERKRYQALTVHEFALSKRASIGTFTQKLSTAAIDADEWLPIDLPMALAEHLLDDRVWKRDHTWAVPILAQWKKVRSQIPATQASPAPVMLRLKRIRDSE